jgi:hypothetical protein
MGVCILAVIVWRAEHTHRIILSYAARLAQPYFQHYLTNGMNFGKGLLNKEMCRLIFSASFI